MTQAIKDLIEAGEKFSSSECKIEIVVPDDDNLFPEDHTYTLVSDNQTLMDDRLYYPEPVSLVHAQFFAQAANARADIKAMYELMEEMGTMLDSMRRYAKWQIAEGANFHPTLPSAILKTEQVLTKFNAMKG